MAYYLTVTIREKNKNTFKIFDLRNARGFIRSSTYSGNCYSLKEIDDFTSQFRNEDTLKISLNQDGIMNDKDILKVLAIRTKYKNEYKKVIYGLVYSDTKKYLNIDYLYSTILAEQDNFDFLKKLVSRYRNSFANSLNVGILQTIVTTGDQTNHTTGEVLDWFFVNEVYTWDKQNKEYTINYRGLHDLAMFVINYYANKQIRDLEQQERMQADDRLLTKQRGKTLVRAKNNQDEQLSFFD